MNLAVLLSELSTNALSTDSVCLTTMYRFTVFGGEIGPTKSRPHLSNIPGGMVVTACNQQFYPASTLLTTS